MAWWHRESCLWARTPIHRHARGALRDHEALLRTRCFSKSNPKTAQHRNDGSERPSGMSNLEWAQHQRYQRWKRRFEADPYVALFGASEDMLNGKGLKNWSWVQSSFPKWMIDEMGLDKPEDEETSPANPQGKHSDDAESLRRSQPSDDRANTKKVNTSKDRTPTERRPLSPEPSIRSSRVEPDRWNAGIASPSDSRRPREQSSKPIHMPPPPELSTGSDKRNRTNAISHRPLSIKSKAEKPSAFEKQQHLTSAEDGIGYLFPPLRRIQLRKQQNALEAEKRGEVTTSSSETVSSRKTTDASDSSFLDKFLADDPSTGTSWRQTSLDRLKTPENVRNIGEPRRSTNLPAVEVTARKETAVDWKPPDFQEAHNTSHKERDIPTYPRWLETLYTPLDDATKVKPTEDYSAWLSVPGDQGKTLDEIPMEKWATTEPVKKDPGSYQEHESNNMEKASLSEDKGVWTCNVSMNKEWLIQPDLSTDQPLRRFPGTTAPSNTHKSTTDKLKSLPEDDIDFLSASDIRASMGRAKSGNKDMVASREKLDASFEAVHRDESDVHPLIEARVLNNQRIRRKERELLQSQAQIEVQQDAAISAGAQEEKHDKFQEQNESSGRNESPENKESCRGGQTIAATTHRTSVLETSLDFMSRWLHTGGNVFAQHFWQDPVQVTDENRGGTCDEPFMKGIVKGIQAGQRAMAQVKDDLAVDLPASQPLLTRLNANEVTVLSISRRKSAPMLTSGAIEEVNSSRVRKMRRALVSTDDDYRKACEAVDSMDNRTDPTEALKRRLRHGADVLQKNVKLTRMMIFGLQTRSEKSGIGGLNQSGRDLVQHILALHDTQTALSRLVDRSMQARGISAKAEDTTTYSHVESTAKTSSDSPSEAALTTKEKESNAERRLRNAAADAKLDGEVSAQKAAMRGLADDGYRHPPKTTARKPFDGTNPLAHSLFRPFTLQLDSLGKEMEVETSSAKAAKKEKADRELVKEVREAYEDVYGPITVEHRQAVSSDKPAVEGDKDVDAPARVASNDAGSTKMTAMSTPFQMLKEDKVSPTVSTPTFDPVMSTLSANETLSESLKTNGAAEKARYTVYTYDSQSDEILVTSSEISAPSQNEATPIALHEALATLNNPAKFLSHLPGNVEIVTARPDMLVVRSTDELAIKTTRIPASASSDSDVTNLKDECEGWKDVNPIDGMSRLSPTGFVGDGLDLERDFDERRKAAGEYHGRRTRESSEGSRNRASDDRSGRREKRRGGASSVMKTAVVAAATCYVVGVAAELVR